jgi:hypothetical protein
VDEEDWAGLGEDGELFAAAGELGDRVAFEEVGGGGAALGADDFADVAAEELGADDLLAEEMGLEAAAEAFDFGELGHRC